MAKKEAKSQAALEFLTTYAWAFMVIILTVGALYYFGVFNFSRFLEQKCMFPSQFQCIEFSFVGDQVRFKLVNNIGEKINVVGYAITNDAVNPLSCTSPSTFSNWMPGEQKDFVFSGCTDGGFIVRERSEAEIAIQYCAPDTPNCPIHILTGKISAVVI